jgi:hypothetical protein
MSEFALSAIGFGGTIIAALCIWETVRIINRGELKSQLAGAAIEGVGVFILIMGLIVLIARIMSGMPGYVPVLSRVPVILLLIPPIAGWLISKFGVWLRRP